MIKPALSLSLLALVGALGGCAAMRGDVTEMPVFVLEEQPRGDVVEIASVTLVRPGYVVIHDRVDGEPGAVLGHSELLDPGTHEDLSIALDSSGTGDAVVPMLHTDDGDGTYEFPGPDAPVMVEGRPVIATLSWL